MELQNQIIQLIDSKSDVEVASDYEKEILLLNIIDFIPDRPNKETLKQFVGSMVDSAKANKYLVEVFKLAQDENITFDNSFVASVYRGVLAAWCCEEYVKLSINDPEKFDKAEKTLMKQYLWVARFKNTTNSNKVFELVKHLTVESGRYLRKELKDNFDQYLVKPLLTLNIAEALINDKSNSKWSAIPLLLNQAYCVKDDENYSEIKFQNSSDWVNTYIIWNLAVITELDSFAEIACKLMFPALTSQPSHFIRKRAISLHMMISLMSVNQYNSDCPAPLKEIITKVANFAAIDYSTKNYDVNPSLFNKLVLSFTHKKCA